MAGGVSNDCTSHHCVQKGWWWFPENKGKILKGLNRKSSRLNLHSRTTCQFLGLRMNWSRPVKGADELLQGRNRKVSSVWTRWVWSGSGPFKCRFQAAVKYTSSEAEDPGLGVLPQKSWGGWTQCMLSRKQSGPCGELWRWPAFEGWAEEEATEPPQLSLPHSSTRGRP